MFVPSAGNYYIVYTPGDRLLEFAEIRPGPRDYFDGKYIMFSVKAARDAVIALLPSEYSLDHGTPYYEVIIGAEDNEEMHIVKVHTDGTPSEIMKKVKADINHTSIIVCQMLTQQLDQANNKESKPIKAPHYWLHHRGAIIRKRFHVMTSSWKNIGYW